MRTHIKLGVIVGAALAIIHLAFTLGMIKSGHYLMNDIVITGLNSLGYALLTFGIYKKQISCLIILFIYYMGSREWALWLNGESLISIVLPMVFGSMLLISFLGFKSSAK